MNKEQDLKYIRQFMAISVKNVCMDLKISDTNIGNGRASEKTIHKVRVEIERRIEVLKEELK
jgi:hypothetical protein